MSIANRRVACAAALWLIASAAPCPGQGHPASQRRSEGTDGENAPEQPGLKVGETAPRFTLKDQEGKARSLHEFLRKGKVALVFYRSADW